MQIELEPEIESRLRSQAEQRGITVAELIKEAVATEPHEERKLTDAERHAFFEAHIEWMKRNSPGWETADPYAVDWQAIKAEGRRY
jgi:predicted DNA-binding protein